MEVPYLDHEWSRILKLAQCSARLAVFARGANPKDVERVKREAMVFAKHMLELRDARGANVSR